MSQRRQRRSRGEEGANLVKGGEGLHHPRVAWQRSFGKIAVMEGLPRRDALLGIKGEEAHEQIEACVCRGGEHLLSDGGRIRLRAQNQGLVTLRVVRCGPDGMQGCQRTLNFIFLTKGSSLKPGHT